MFLTKGRFIWVGWLDLLVGFFVVTRAAFAGGIIYKTTLIYGVALLANGVVLRVAQATDQRVVRLAWLLRAFLYTAGVIPFGYALLLPLWSSEQNTLGDTVFFFAGILFFAPNVGFSIWAQRRSHESTTGSDPDAHR